MNGWVYMQLAQPFAQPNLGENLHIIMDSA